MLFLYWFGCGSISNTYKWRILNAPLFLFMDIDDVHKKGTYEKDKTRYPSIEKSSVETKSLLQYCQRNTDWHTIADFSDYYNLLVSAHHKKDLFLCYGLENNEML